jgi:hypothetical protein
VPGPPTAQETLLFCHLVGIAPPALAGSHLPADEERELIERHMLRPTPGCCGEP